MATAVTIIITVVIVTVFCTPNTHASFSLLMQKLHSSLKESLMLLDSLRDENLAEANLLSGLGRPSSCAELLLTGQTKSGIYTIYPRIWYNAPPFQVYCDMETDGGGWTLIQRRDDYGEPVENFYRSWSEYKKGFGNLSKEFWLGNEHLYILTNQDHVSLRIDLGDFEGGERYAVYEEFRVENKERNYKATIANYKGDVGDDLSQASGYEFVTYDKDTAHSCAKNYKGGWWYYVKCHRANLNGMYLKGNYTSSANGVNWYSWKGNYYSLKKSEMKVRPRNFLICDESFTFSVTPS